MSFAAARSDIVTAAEAARQAWAPYPLLVDYQNRDLIDIDNQGNPYVAVNIYFLDGQQLSLGKTVAVADYGQVHIVACAPERSGSLRQMNLLDHFRSYFELKSFSVVRTRHAQGAAPTTKNGWSSMPLVVPFWVHRLVAT